MSKLFKITYFHFKALKEQGYSLDSLFILHLIDSGIDIAQLGDHRADLLREGLIRKNLITSDNKITDVGQKLLLFCETKAKKLKLPKVEDKFFDEWWDSFPSTNFFEYKGKQFIGSQSKRVKGTECRSLFNQMVTSGEFTAEEIIKATKFHINLTKEQSFSEGKNGLTYISNSYTYLQQKKFQPFIELSMKIVPSKPAGGVDI